MYVQRVRIYEDEHPAQDVIGFFYVKNRGRGSLVGRFVPRRKRADRDFLRIAEEDSAGEEGEDQSPEQQQEESAEDCGGDIQQDSRLIADYK